MRGGPAQAGRRIATPSSKLLLSTPVPGGVNLAITSHGNPFARSSAAPYLAEGEVAIIEPRGKQGFRVVARIRKDEWSALAQTK